MKPILSGSLPLPYRLPENRVGKMDLLRLGLMDGAVLHSAEADAAYAFEVA
ncbi:hypothetical protein H9Q10_00530 [Eikenella sp. S3360]|uniref:Uncharacterized protein n=1 Tax=Eikenella glucosivorans TaxID=2766967 RepID=A0ABS0N770_9NEIS|nr:hypothetical protein [Eikenella glucosivorans]MBH5328162.1 hypothetical protein [Eikenella glucosivorans]